MNWVKCLILDSNLSIERRVKDILIKVFNNYGSIQFAIKSIDATGKIGNDLTHKSNLNSESIVDISDLIALFDEDGQVFELDVYTNQIGYSAILISDGTYVEFLGTSENAVVIDFLGEHTDLDPDSFLFPA